MKPTALVMIAPGTNRHHDVAEALRLAGAECRLLTTYELRQQPLHFAKAQLLIIPGGFSYGDNLGAGKLLALDLQTFFQAEVSHFVASGKPVLGICNGFQALVKAGLLPANQAATLTRNREGRFQCRWVRLEPKSQRCLWTRELSQPIACPIAHGEGNFQCADPQSLFSQDQVAFTYLDNPNGSALGIAGVCNEAGNVLGLMPHPENHLFAYQASPRERAHSGLPLFEQGVLYAAR